MARLCRVSTLCWGLTWCIEGFCGISMFHPLSPLPRRPPSAPFPPAQIFSLPAVPRVSGRPFNPICSWRFCICHTNARGDFTGALRIAQGFISYCVSAAHLGLCKGLCKQFIWQDYAGLLFLEYGGTMYITVGLHDASALTIPASTTR